MTEKEVNDAGVAIAKAIGEITTNPKLAIGGHAQCPAAFQCAFKAAHGLIKLYNILYLDCKDE